MQANLSTGCERCKHQLKLPQAHCVESQNANCQRYVKQKRWTWHGVLSYFRKEFVKVAVSNFRAKPAAAKSIFRARARGPHASKGGDLHRAGRRPCAVWELACGSTGQSCHSAAWHISSQEFIKRYDFARRSANRIFLRILTLLS